jgi:hypothetical protein
MRKRSKYLTKEPELMEVLKNPTIAFFSDMANVKDEHLHILRGHLLIEKKLRDLINLKVKKSGALSEARLTFNQILYITEAFHWEKNSDWLWESIKKLNNIRNSFSHQLTPKKYNEYINEFLSICEDNNPDKFGKELSVESRLVLAMHFIYHNLDGYIEDPANSKMKNIKK